MEQKKFVKVGLSTENLRLYVGMVEDEVEEFLSKDSSFFVYQLNDVNEWGAFDVVQVMQEITILTASRTLQGKEIRGALTKDFAQIYNDLDAGFTPLNFMFPNLPLESYRKRDRAHKAMSEFYLKIVQKRRDDNSEVSRIKLEDRVLAIVLNHSQAEHDMIAALSEQKYRKGNLIPDHEIAHLMITLLMTGQHTSSASGAWTLLHLAHNPDVA